MINLIYIIVSVLVLLFLLRFVFETILEQQRRATILGLIGAISWGLMSTCFWISGVDILRVILPTLIIGFAFVFFLPIGGHKTNVRIASRRIDERDTIFARMRLGPGSELYEKYYRLRPEYKKTDDNIRKRPGLLKPGSKHYDKLRSTYVETLFSIEENNIQYIDGPVSPSKTSLSTGEATELIKDKLKHLGAGDIGIALIDESYLYSHVGIPLNNWGNRIEMQHKYAIVYTLEMRYEKVAEAPCIGITEESADRYISCQKISNALAAYIRSLGYSARSHVSGSDYQLILPAVAEAAGLGQLSRMGYLISNSSGPRVRLGAVSTELALVPDKPVSLGVPEFCAVCSKCAVNCPSRSISMGPPEIIRGVEKWPFKIEQCYKYWREIGTDCGLCMKVCPFSHPDTFIHKLIRLGIKKSAVARYVSAIADDIVYGKHSQKKAK